MRTVMIFFILTQTTRGGFGLFGYNQERYPNLTYLEYFWRFHDVTLGVFPALLASIMISLHEKTPHPVFPRIINGLLISGAALLITASVVRHVTASGIVPAPLIWLVVLAIIFRFPNHLRSPNPELQRLTQKSVPSHKPQKPRDGAPPRSHE